METLSRLHQLIDQQASPELDALFQRYYDEIGGWYSVPEGRTLYNQVLNCPVEGCIIEIGDYEGKSTMYLAAGARLTGEKVYAVDPHTLGERICEKFQANIKKFSFENQIIHLHMTSQEALKNWHEPVKMLFVDGEHTYEAVKIDSQWLEHLQPGGLASFHDGGTPGVLQAVNEFVRSRRDMVEYPAASLSNNFVKLGHEWWNP